MPCLARTPVGLARFFVLPRGVCVRSVAKCPSMLPPLLHAPYEPRMVAARRELGGQKQAEADGSEWARTRISCGRRMACSPDCVCERPADACMPVPSKSVPCRVAPRADQVLGVLPPPD